jgi:hypothetical protein
MTKNLFLNEGFNSIMIETNGKLTKEVSKLREGIEQNEKMFDTDVFNGFLRDKISRIQNQIHEMHIFEGNSTVKVDVEAKRTLDYLLDVLYGSAAETYGVSPGIPLKNVLPLITPCFERIAKSNGILTEHLLN